jgi:hypothetical protein
MASYNTSYVNSYSLRGRHSRLPRGSRSVIPGWRRRQLRRPQPSLDLQTSAPKTRVCARPPAPAPRRTPPAQPAASINAPKTIARQIRLGDKFRRWARNQATPKTLGKSPKTQLRRQITATKRNQAMQHPLTETYIRTAKFAEKRYIRNRKKVYQKSA